MSSLRESFLLSPAVTRIRGRELGVGGVGNSDPVEDICLNNALPGFFFLSDDRCLIKPVLFSIILDHIKINIMQSIDHKMQRSDRTGEL